MYYCTVDDPCGSVLCNNGGSCQSDGSCQCTTYCFGSECDDCIIGTQRPVSTPLKINNVQCDVLIEGGWIVSVQFWNNVLVLTSPYFPNL